MQRLTLVIALVLAITVGSALGSAPTETPTPAAPVAKKAPKKLRNGCKELYSQEQFKHYARRVYTRKAVTYTARKQMVTMVRCQHSPKAERKMRHVRKQLVKARKYRAWVASLTPFGPCYGGYWAVPCSIIGCESGGNWKAYNKSGARGPYQFLGWAVPWPVVTAWQKIKHHIQGARLWAGGRGASHWTQCL